MPVRTWLCLLLLPACIAEGQVIRDQPPVEEPEPEPEPELEPPRRVVDLATFAKAGCAVLDDGRVHCWGENWFFNPDGEMPASFDDLDDVVAVDGFLEYGCVHHADGGLSCWGFSHYNQLGGAVPIRESSVDPLRLPHVEGAVSVSTGHHHACMIDESQRARCWGNSYTDALHTGHAPEEPVTIETGAPAKLVGAGLEGLCVVDVDNRMVCQGQVLSNRTFAGNRLELDLPIDAVGLHVGWDGACVWDAAGALWCLGAMGAEDGSLGRADLDEVKEFVGQYGSSCAIVGEERRLVCDRGAPDLVDVWHLAAEGSIGCVVTGDERVACWEHGQTEVTWIDLPE